MYCQLANSTLTYISFEVMLVSGSDGLLKLADINGPATDADGFVSHYEYYINQGFYFSLKLSTVALKFSNFQDIYQDLSIFFIFFKTFGFQTAQIQFQKSKSKFICCNLCFSSLKFN